VRDVLGEAGVVDSSDGAGGGRLSSTYVIPLEQAPVRPSVGSAFAKTVVELLLLTINAIANAPVLPAVLVLSGPPMHPAVVKRPTGTPGAVVPRNDGRL
jgi:hypothetical protein